MLPTIMPEASKNSYNHRKDSFIQTAKASKISIITVMYPYPNGYKTRNIHFNRNGSLIQTVEISKTSSITVRTSSAEQLFFKKQWSCAPQQIISLFPDSP